MSMETMSVIVEVWPLAADEHGIWLVSGSDAWRSSAIYSDSEPHFEVELILAGHGAELPNLLHSTSWRPDGQRIVLTYVAVLDGPGPALSRFPAAKPVPAELLDEVGNPVPHGAAEVPIPQYIHVLYHGLRHLRFLLDTDASARLALGSRWAKWLSEMSPALAGMYEGLPG